MTQAEMDTLVAEVDRALGEPITWIEDRATLREQDAITFTGRVKQNDGGGWFFTLVEYPVDDKHRAVGGTAMKLGTIVHLPPALARKALERAKGRPS
jgi:hypothetical protein